MHEHTSDVSTFELFRQNETASVLVEHTRKALKLNSALPVDHGSVLARRLRQYQELLGHNGAINFLEVARAIDNPTIIDAGCSAGVALAELRIIFKNANLVGIDIRRSTLNTLYYQDGGTKKVNKIFEENNIKFHQDTFLNAHKLVPEGYDVFLAVGSFYYRSDVPYGDVFKELYDGLRKGGIIQVLFNPLEEKTFSSAMSDLEKTKLPYNFTPADETAMRKNGLRWKPSMTGTLTVGPKT